MRAIRWGPSLVCLFLGATPQARADWCPDVRRGDRVRYTTTDRAGPPAIATVIRREGDSLIVRSLSTSAPVSLPLSSLDRLDVWRVRTHAREGALIGLVVGAAAG